MSRGKHAAPVQHPHVGRAVVTGTLAVAATTGTIVAVAPAATAAPVPASAPVLASFVAPVRQVLPAPPATPTPSPASAYTVVRGDTLSGIGARVGEGWQQLYTDNRPVIGANPNLIFPGQRLALSGGQPAPAAPAAPAPAAPPAQAPSSGRHAMHAHITNSAGPVRPQTQAAADNVVTDVPGAASITLGGTRASAIDPHGHPSGLAIDYMVGLGNTALGNAIVQYHIDHWGALGVEYIIYKQRILLSPHGTWQPMEDRGSPTQNHMDHVHVNYRG